MEKIENAWICKKELHERKRERKTKEDTAPLTRLSNLSQCGGAKPN